MGKRSRKRQQSPAGKGAALRAVSRPAPPWDPAGSGDDTAPPRPWRALCRDHWLPVVVIAAVALAVRAAALAFIAHSPYREVSNIDSDSYEKWARDILTTGWRPTRHFYQSPLYAYFLAVVYKLFGQGPWAPRIIQIFVGSASAGLLYGIGASLFRRRVGWLAGLGLAVYGPLILEEVTVSKTTLLVLTVLASFAIFLRYAPSARLPGIALSGVLLGISVSGVGQWMLGFLAFGAFTGLVPPELSRRRRVLVSAVFLAAGLCVIAPEVAWNTYKAGGFLLTGGGGLNFYEGNNERASSLPAKPNGVRDIPQFEEEDSARVAQEQSGSKLNPAEVQRYWTRQALDFIRRQPGAYLTLLWKKFQILWNAYEIPDNYHYAFVREQFVPVFYGCLSFGQVAPLALIGMAFPFWRRKTILAMIVLCFSYLATLLLFYVRSRYRIPMMPFLLVFAAVGVERSIAWARSLDWRLIPAGVGLIVAAAFINQSYCEPPAHGFRQACMTGDIWYDEEWMKIGGWYDGKGYLDQAIYCLRKATDCSAPRGPGQMWYWLGTLEQRKVEALLGQNPPAAAQEHIGWAEMAYHQCMRVGYRLPAAYFNLTALYARALLADRASETIDEGFQAKALDRAALFRIARSQAQSRNCGGAEIVLARADRDLGYYSAEAKAILAGCASN
jgi:4-amino-4-deoxy-L-arabinose transferase-like glycosyltransferase